MWTSYRQVRPKSTVLMLQTLSVAAAMTTRWWTWLCQVHWGNSIVDQPHTIQTQKAHLLLYQTPRLITLWSQMCSTNDSVSWQMQLWSRLSSPVRNTSKPENFCCQENDGHDSLSGWSLQCKFKDTKDTANVWHIVWYTAMPARTHIMLTCISR